MKRLFLATIVLCLSIASYAIEITKLTCEFQQDPLAINTLQPRFGWQMKSAENGSLQSAYEIELRILYEPTEDYIWETGL